MLAATVRSFAHMPLGISDRNSFEASPGINGWWRHKCLSSIVTCNDWRYKSTIFSSVRRSWLHFSIPFPPALQTSLGWVTGWFEIWHKRNNPESKKCYGFCFGRPKCKSGQYQRFQWWCWLSCRWHFLAHFIANQRRKKFYIKAGSRFSWRKSKTQNCDLLRKLPNYPVSAAIHQIQHPNPFERRCGTTFLKMF